MISVLTDTFLKKEIGAARDDWGSLSGLDLQNAVRHRIARELGSLAQLYFHVVVEAAGADRHPGILNVFWEKFWRCAEDAANEARESMKRLHKTTQSTAVDLAVAHLERALTRFREECDEILASASRVGLLTEERVVIATASVWSSSHQHPLKPRRAD